MALACTTSPARTRLRSKRSYRCHVLQGVTDILDSVFTMASRPSALCIAQQVEKHTFGDISEIISSLRQCTISRPQIGFLYDLQIQTKWLPALRHLNHSLYKDDGRSYTVAWAGDYGSTHPADSSVVTSGLAQELRPGLWHSCDPQPPEHRREPETYTMDKSRSHYREKDEWHDYRHPILLLLTQFWMKVAVVSLP